MRIRSMTYVLYAFLALLLFLCDRAGILTFAHHGSDIAVIPFKRIVSEALSVGRVIPDAVWVAPRATSLINELSLLRQQVAEKELALGELKSENASLRSQLNSPYSSNYQLIISPVISLGNYLDVEAGSSDGVKVGMPAVNGNTLIGMVSAVHDHRSLIRILRDPGSKIAARTQNGVKGDVVGNLGETIRLDKILQRDIVLLKDVITTSGTDGLPPKLLIGKIRFVQSDDVSVYKYADIEPAIDVDRISYVFIIANTQ